jgi:hypothetical protein
MHHGIPFRNFHAEFFSRSGGNSFADVHHIFIYSSSFLRLTQKQKNFNFTWVLVEECVFPLILFHFCQTCGSECVKIPDHYVYAMGMGKISANCPENFLNHFFSHTYEFIACRSFPNFIFGIFQFMHFSTH